MTSFAQIAVDCVPRYVSHSIGASMFFLGFALAHTGVITFIIVLVIEAYFTGNSLLYIQEIAKADTEYDKGETNYFFAIEKHFPNSFRLFIRLLFFVDVVNCTAFYYKVSQALVEALIFDDKCSTRERTGSMLVTFCVVTLLLIGMEYGQKYMQKPHQKLSQQCSISQVRADVVNVAFGSQQNDEDDDGKINMAAVEREMNNFSRKRPLLLLLFMLLFFATIAVSYDTRANVDIHAFNASTRCIGLLKPISWIKLDVHIFSAVAIVIYALKNYTIMLPVCVDELSYSKENYRRLVHWSEITLVVVYAFVALSVYLTFGESVPALFPTGYGKNFVGLPITSLALGMTVMAMLLRIMACFKLIQVLFCKDDTENVYWLVVIFSFFASLLLALMASDVLYLVVFAGCVTCNFLVVILPTVSYTNQKWQESGLNLEILVAFSSLVWHIGLLIATPIALYSVDIDNGEGCRTLMNYYWSDGVLESSTCGR